MGWKSVPIMLAGALVVTGCSSQGTASTAAPSATPAATSAANDCAAIAADIATLGLDIGAVIEELGTNPLGALLRIPGIIDRATSTYERVSDPELRAQLDAILATLQSVAEEAQAAATSSNPESAIDVVTSGLVDVQAQIDNLTAYCESVE